MGFCTRGARLPGNGPTEWSEEGYPGTIVDSELGFASIEAIWVTCYVDAIRIEAFEEVLWWDIPAGPGVNLEPEWGQSLTASRSRQTNSCVCLIGMGCTNDHPERSHTVATQCWHLHSQPSFPSFHINHPYPLISYWLEQWIGCSCWSDIWTASYLLGDNLCRQILKQGNWHIPVHVSVYNSGTEKIASVGNSEVDRTSGLYWCFCWYTLQQLQTQCHIMYGLSPVDAKHLYHSWPWEVPSTAQCHHPEYHEPACIGPQTQQLHCSYHLLVHSEKVGIYNPWVHQLSHLSSSWYPPACRL